MVRVHLVMMWSILALVTNVATAWSTPVYISGKAGFSYKPSIPSILSYIPPKSLLLALLQPESEYCRDKLGNNAASVSSAISLTVTLQWTEIHCKTIWLFFPGCFGSKVFIFVILNAWSVGLDYLKVFKANFKIGHYTNIFSLVR